jgi:hypothetical protein
MLRGGLVHKVSGVLEQTADPVIWEQALSLLVQVCKTRDGLSDLRNPAYSIGQVRVQSFLFLLPFFPINLPCLFFYPSRHYPQL